MAGGGWQCINGLVMTRLRGIDKASKLILSLFDHFPLKEAEASSLRAIYVLYIVHFSQHRCVLSITFI